MTIRIKKYTYKIFNPAVSFIEIAGLKIFSFATQKGLFISKSRLYELKQQSVQVLSEQ